MGHWPTERGEPEPQKYEEDFESLALEAVPRAPGFRLHLVLPPKACRRWAELMLPVGSCRRGWRQLRRQPVPSHLPPRSWHGPGGVGSGCPRGGNWARQEGGDREAAEDVSASEDLMREHGVLRRTLIVYAELAGRLRNNATAVDPGALLEAAKLFREFGEHYHERTLEERYIFPEVGKAGGANEKLVEILLRQHQRGREITDYASSVAARGQLQ